MNCSRLSGISILSRKWSFFTLRALRKPRTFSELKRELQTITNHTLSGELKHLLKDGLLTSVENQYVLTAAGKGLLEAAEGLHLWAVKHQRLVHCPAEQDCSQCARYGELVRGP